MRPTAEPPTGSSDVALGPVLAGLAVAALFVATDGLTARPDAADPRAVAAVAFVLATSFVLGRFLGGLGVPEVTAWVAVGALAGPVLATLVPEGLRPGPLVGGYLSPDVLRDLGPVADGALWLAVFAGGQEAGRGRGGGSPFRTLALPLAHVVTAAVVAGLAATMLMTRALDGTVVPGLLADTPAPLALGAILGVPLLAGSPALVAASVQSQRAEGAASRALARGALLQLLLFAAVAPLLVPTGLAPVRALPPALAAGAALGLVLGPASQGAGRFQGPVAALLVVAAGLLAEALGAPALPLAAAAGFVSAFASRGGARLAATFADLGGPARWLALTLLGAALLRPSDDPGPVAAFAGALWLLRAGLLWGAARAVTRAFDLEEVFARHGWAAGLPRAELVAAFGLALVTGGDPATAVAGQVICAMVLLDLLVGPRALRFLLQSADEGPDLQGTLVSGVGVAQRAPREAFGPNPRFASERLDRELVDLRFDLERLHREVKAGLLDPFRDEGETYLRELRREFLRHHRRVTVMARTSEDAGALANELRAQQSELADRWRGIVLGRAAVLGKGRWRTAPYFEALDRAIEAIPLTLNAPIEERSYARRAGEPWWRGVERAWLRFRRRAREALGILPPSRRVPLRAVVRYHLTLEGTAGLEATLACLVEAQGELVARTRSLFDSIVLGYDEIAAELRDGGGAPQSGLERVRREVEEELAFVAGEVDRVGVEGDGRLAGGLGAAFRRTAEDVATVGTLDLPSRERTDPRPVRRYRRYAAGLTERHEAWRKAGSAEFGLLALELELVGLEARLKEALTRTMDELAGDVRGRTAVQAERVEGALREALEDLESALSEGRPSGEVAQRVRQRSETVERVVGEALRGATQLRDQLGNEATIAPFLDGLRRAALSLAERYTVPAAPPGRGEWQLAPPPAVLEVPFRDVVAAHIETAVAPKLLAITRSVGREVEPLVASLAELERRLAFNVELATADLESQPDEPVAEAGQKLLREMVGATMDRSLELLAGHEKNAERWPDALRERIGEAVLGGVRDLRRRFIDGDISELRVQFLRQAAAGRQLVRRAGRLPGLLRRTRADGTRVVRQVVGEDRIDAARRFLGLPQGLEGREPLAQAFAPPRSSERLPLVYRRLFSPESLEAGDVLTGREPEIRRGVAALEAGGGDGRSRAVALVGLDGVGKGAVAAAVVRASRFKTSRRVMFEGPTSPDEVRERLQPKGGALTVVGGLHWLVHPGPGGFDGIRRLAEVLVRDGGQQAFVLQVDSVVWTFLEGVAGLDAVVADAIELAPFDKEALEAALIARHNLSGMGLSFDPRRRESVIEEALLQLASRVRRPYDSYFRRLHVSSGGLVRDALRLWLASIDTIDTKGDLVHVGRVPGSPMPAIRALPEEALVTLAAILRLGWIDARGFASLFRVDEVTAEARLARLGRWGLLKKVEGAYRIAVHLRGPVHRALAERGWVR